MLKLSDECLWVSNHLVVFLRSIVTLQQCQDTLHGIWRVLTVPSSTQLLQWSLQTCDTFIIVTGFRSCNPSPNQSSHSFWNWLRAELLLAYNQH